ncbi:MAG: methyltransferase domain-containing protein [Actinobacteria bacterium]|nr:methyltransferase domain-containing protein [Actinomycetota bacterium]
MPIKEERTVAADFGERYGRSATEATRELDRSVIGGDFGANGYTTLAQADMLADRLALSDGDRLLDVGSGRGWPGLYLAGRTGCSVVLTDLPREAMAAARERARREGLADRARLVAASARCLPFRHQAFDAIVHTDVLC